MNPTTPVNAAIREREELNDAAEAAWEAERENREQEAVEAIKTPEGLKTILNDDYLAYPLARQLYNLEGAIAELTKLQIDRRVEDREMICIRALIQATAAIERDLFSRKLEELEDHL